MPMLRIGLVAFFSVAISSPTIGEPTSGAMQTIERLAPGVWSIHQYQPFAFQPVGKVEVIEQRRGLVMIDGGASPGSATRIAQLIKSVSDKPVTAIAITDWHPEHSLGVTTILKYWPHAEVIATNATRDHILGEPLVKTYPVAAPDPTKMKPLFDRVGQGLNLLRQRSTDETLSPDVRASYARGFEEFALYRKDLDGAFLPAKIDTFETERVVNDPDRPVHLRFLGRGNTDGDLIAWLPKQRIVATGDLVASPIPYGTDCYGASWQFDLDKLIALHARVIIPGHGLPMRDDSYLRRLRAMLSGLRSRMAAIGPKEDLDQAAKDMEPAFAEYRKSFAGDDERLQKWFAPYWQTPVTQSLWKESRGMPIHQGGG
jgi:glyoxylase-like metal-dependent hydrolase (beta-lactamase superfamily II)